MRPTTFALMLVLAFSLAALTQGCGADGGPTSGLETGNAQPSALASQAAPAASVAELALQHGELVVSRPAEFNALVDRDDGCALANEYVSAVGSADLAGSVGSYCALLASQGRVVRDCARATDLAARIATETSYFSATCARNGHGRGRADENRAKGVVTSGLALRIALGLPIPEGLARPF